uniref:Chlorophyll synthase n=1 Tax=Eucampia antarctica TaxID=49252 RepID=A0A7S2RQF9_9STRA|mmetsp:Transcript_25374/g.24316  ORF Transcript_25374/g.24316 Transcript_25374/m.24316 type:complete len:434 (+) Transcript_25374:55-1356(+)|eukprot:CAMPEP_0197835658 /NCGR_PEP_ID=MMETSP1437-20131217/26555_1 /TAXON_ID=49252 ORGANISM="Eucampia antarctica, Strain CCMP1452" /NCGR_SAMPLE_ID=MMETSP1437 /ASSEMBLY_ACC=CAM_ASM_001096 /LENGTH=433 /DNA_ID=CAMNT_0043441271 /DNA_START=49 /DNA_END=1350 /DNA_ORIENTATION=-
MKVLYSAVAVSALASGASAFASSGRSSNSAFAIRSNVASVPTSSGSSSSSLNMMKKNSESSNSDGSFYPFNSNNNNMEQRTSSTMLQMAKDKGPNSKAKDGSADIRQLLGVKGAAETEDIWKIRLQLTKPVTWIPLLWGVMCGAAASGNYHWIWNPFNPEDRNVMLGLEDTSKAIVAMILAGPFLTGYTQTINDWYDRDIDAINEPYRPIPSGKISEGEVISQVWFLLIGGLVLSYGLDVWCHHDFPINLALAVFGSFVSYIYSAPPLKLKQNGWAGNYALGASYISLPWWCGQAVFGELDRPVFWVLPILYSIAGLGIAIVNDFKSVEGDRAMGLNSLPVAFGIDGAKWICAGSLTVTQLGISAYLYSIQEPLYAAILFGLLLPQIYFQATLLIPDPVKNDVKYQASSQPFFVFGILATAVCLGNHNWDAIV